MTRYLFLIALLAGSLSAAADLPNLVTNPGLEVRAANGLPEGWSGPTAVYSHVTSPVHSGAGAMQFVNPDPAHYALCRQTIPLKPGKMYEFSVWVKCEDIVGNDTGATICLEWYTQDDKYLGGAYPGGIKGTRDWTRVRGQSGRVPANAAKCYVLCYVRQKMTGKAWWDDVEVKQWLEPPLQTMLLQPNYRGIMMGDQNTIRLVAQLKLADYDLAPEDVELRFWLTRVGPHPPPDDMPIPPGAWVVQPKGDTAELNETLRHWPQGDYSLNTRLIRRSDWKEIGRDHWRVSIHSDGYLRKRTSYIDDHNRLIVDGKPFFPLGMYWSGLKEDELRQYADSAFNCVMPYGGASVEQMDLAQSLGLKVIYTLKDAYLGSHYCPPSIKSEADERPYMEAKAQQFRDHPALLAWYLNDELSTDYMPRLEAHQRWMETLDPNHPTWIVLYQVRQLELYRQTFDVLGTDPYPIPMAAARRAATYTIRSRESVMGSRPLWMVPQVMNWANYRKTEEEKQGLRPPTYDEMRSMTWQCLTEGATGLIYYSWFDLKKEPEVFDRRWAEVKQVAAEVKRWAPVLLSIEPTPTIGVDDEEWLHWTARRVGNQVFLFAVNDEEARHQVSFTLPRPPGRVMLGDQNVTPRGAQWTARFRPFELKVYEVTL
jgi:hypothetical protein